MPNSNRRSTRRALLLTWAALAAAGGLAGTSARADDKTQDVDTSVMSFQAPADWKSVTPEPMRQAQMKIDPAKGDEHPAELTVFAFPGGGGGIAANIDRWSRMFRDKDGNSPKAEVAQVKGKNCEITRVELSGHYFPPSFPGRPAKPDQPNSRLLGAIVIEGDTGYFLRLIGPEKTVTAAKPAFDKLLTTVKIKGS